jgi:hypothetical protein
MDEATTTALERSEIMNAFEHWTLKETRVAQQDQITEFR